MLSPPLLRLRLPTLLLLLLPLLVAGNLDLRSDGAALLAFRNAVGRAVLRWNATASPCAWRGVRCLRNRVVFVHLPAAGLFGEIPAGTIGNLTALSSLILRANALSGHFPPDLQRATRLRNLHLQHNRFSGDLPPALFSMRNLVHLNLAGNAFSGEISPAFDNLSRIETLFLEKNRFSGGIPDLVLPNLVQFNVSFNRLNGSVPFRLSKMSASAFLGMSLSGEISPAIAPAAEGAVSGGGKGKYRLSEGAIITFIFVACIVGLVILCIVASFLCRKGVRKMRKVKAPAVSVSPPTKLPEEWRGGTPL